MNKSTSPALKVQCNLHIQRRQRGQKHLRPGAAPMPSPAPTGRVPHISRLMALAIRFEDMLRRGDVKDYADLAHLGHVSRARVTQIMNLLLLAPRIQEAILFLPTVQNGHDAVKEWQLRPIAAEPNWNAQLRKWNRLKQSVVSAEVA